MDTGYQTTIATELTFTGVGLHSGDEVVMTLRPAVADSGVRFTLIRPDMAVPVSIAARADKVAATAYATTLRDGEYALHTVEHLLAALAGLGIDNVAIEIDANEVPIMDGSAVPFVRGLLSVGVVSLAKYRRAIRITRPIRVTEGDDKWLEVLPGNAPETVINYHIDFDHQAVGYQRYQMVLSRDTFISELASARTFGFEHEVEALRRAGLARGGSLDNAVVIGDEGVLNPEGLRYADEQVRHKVLDMIGDLSLLGSPLWGRIEAYRAGHGLHTALAQAILDQPECWEWASGATATAFDGTEAVAV